MFRNIARAAGFCLNPIRTPCKNVVWPPPIITVKCRSLTWPVGSNVPRDACTCTCSDGRDAHNVGRRLEFKRQKNFTDLKPRPDQEISVTNTCRWQKIRNVSDICHRHQFVFHPTREKFDTLGYSYGLVQAAQGIVT